MPIISVRDLVVEYDGRRVLDGLNLDIEPGEIMVLLGGSGSGNSTPLRQILGLERPKAGSISIQGTDITRCSKADLTKVRRSVGVAFQSAALFNSLSLEDNVALNLREHTALAPSIIDLVVWVKLAVVGLADFGKLHPQELSGGMKKRAAEAYTFGAATSRNIEGRFLSALIKGEPEAREAWTAIAQYNRFLAEELYYQAQPVARIALISVEPRNALADEFLKQSVFFETKVLAHLDKGVPLDHFKVLVMPAGLPKLRAEQKARLDMFTSGGGVIITAGEAGIVARAEAAAGGPRCRLEPRGHVLAQLTQMPDRRTFIFHLLNYDHQTPAKNVKVQLDVRGLVDDLSRWDLNVLSPDTAQSDVGSLSLHGSVAEFTLGRIEHYTVVTLSARRGA